MPLFIGRAALKIMVEIPVVAADERAAIEYLNSTNEWKTDSLFCDSSEGDISVVGVERVLTPEMTPDPWDSDCYCWNGFDITVAQAFFDEALNQMEPSGDNATDNDWEDFFRKEEMLCAEFEEALMKVKLQRKKTARLRQALRQALDENKK